MPSSRVTSMTRTSMSAVPSLELPGRKVRTSPEHFFARLYPSLSRIRQRCEKVFGSITENELKEYASLVRYYSEKSKSDNKGKDIGFDLRKIQKNGEILKEYLSSISMNTLNTLLCFSEMV